MKVLIESKRTNQTLIVDADDQRTEDNPHFRVISPLVRDTGYAGTVYRDQWGGVWRLNEVAENISDAMEKWL